MSEHYNTTQECPKCGIHHDTDDHFCDGLSASTCSLCGGMGELEGFAGVGRMPCHRCEQFAAEGGTDGRILESRRPLPSVATSHQKENTTDKGA